MTNEESESVEPAPEVPADGEAMEASAPEVPGVEASEAPAAGASDDAADRKRTGLIFGVAVLVVLVIGCIVGGLAIGGVFSGSDTSPASATNSASGDPAAVVKAYFASRTCADAQKQLTPAEWSEMSATAGGTSACQDAQVKASFSAITVAVQSATIADNMANVDVTVTSASSSTPQKATINLIPVKGTWKIDHIIAKTS